MKNCDYIRVRDMVNNGQLPSSEDICELSALGQEFAENIKKLTVSGDTGQAMHHQVTLFEINDLLFKILAMQGHQKPTEASKGKGEAANERVSPQLCVSP